MTESVSGKSNPDHVYAHHKYHQYIPMWTIYRPTTKDYPGKWLARMFLTIPKMQVTDLLIIADSLEDVRARLPPGLISLNRSPEDDPVIEEVWF